LLHLSFHDFLVDKKRCSNDQFRIDEPKSHSDLVEHCLKVMSSVLRKDICKLGKPGFLAREVAEDLKGKFLPTHVQYACRYWIDHLTRSDLDLSENGQVYGFFGKHFLHWLESLSLMGSMPKGVASLTDLQFKIMVSDYALLLLRSQMLI